MLFCNSDIILEKLNYNQDTYDKKFEIFFKRDINRLNINDLIIDIPIFIKPYIDKLFDGVVIYSNEDIKYYILI